MGGGKQSLLDAERTFILNDTSSLGRVLKFDDMIQLKFF